MFPQAMTSTSATTASMIIRGRSNRFRSGDKPPHMGDSVNGCSRNDRASWRSVGNTPARICGCTARSAAVAASIVWPGFIRNITVSHVIWSVSGVAGCTRGCTLIGTAMSNPLPTTGPKKSAGATPTMVAGVRSTITCAPIDARRPGETALPQSMTDDDHRTVRPSAVDVVGDSDCATEDRPHSERREIVAADEMVLDRLARASVGQHRLAAERPGEGAIERRPVAANLVERFVAGPVPWLQNSAETITRAMWIPDRQRAQQQPVHEGKDCGVGADAEREGEESDGGDDRCPAQRTDGEPEILKHVGLRAA